MKMNRIMIFGFFVHAASSFAAGDRFNVEDLPIGAEVTVPAASRTILPGTSVVKVASTDNPQTMSIVPVGVNGAAAVPVMVAIFDAKQERVKYVQVAPGAPFLYSFKGLSAITIKTKPVKPQAGVKTVQLELESNKPLTVGR